MRKHGGPPSRRDKHVTLAAISPPGVARGRFVGGQKSGLAGCKPPPLFTRGASSCSSQGRRQGEPRGASPRPSAPTYLPMPFGVANAPALFQELMNKILYILRRRPLVQELISRGAEMEAHIDDVSLDTNTKEDHVLLLREFFIVCQENNLRIKLEKCEFMKEEMGYFGFDPEYGWWKPAASKMQNLQDMQIRDDPKKGLHDVRTFVGACNFYRRHIHNFTYSSAPLTDLIKKTTPCRWTSREGECFQELKKKIASSNCLGVPRPEGKVVLITDASDVGGGGTIYQWQELNPAELTHCHYRTTGLNRDGSLKHDYPTSEWRLVPLGH